jgi:hypothetical protein
MPDKVHIFMFIDALGWEIVNRHHFMEDTLPHRHQAKMQFGYSSTAIPTILTGQPPIMHKHLSFYYYSPVTSPFKIFRYLLLQYLPRRFFDRWRVRHILSKIIAYLYGFTGYFELYSMPYSRLPYFDYIEKNDIFVPGGLMPVKNLADILAAAKVSWHISNWRLSETENIQMLENKLKSGTVQFAFLYTAALDGLLHFNVNNPEKIQQKLDWYAERIKKLIETAKQNYKEFSFTVVSDHGMTPLNSVTNIKSDIEQLKLKFGRDYAAVYDSTMARFWFLNHSAKEKILSCLSANPHGHVLSEDEKIKYGINFSDNMYGEAIFLTAPGCQIEPCDMGLKALPGMHGFAPEDKDSFASCLSTEPLPFELKWVGDYFKLMQLRIEDLCSKS